MSLLDMPKQSPELFVETIKEIAEPLIEHVDSLGFKDEQFYQLLKQGVSISEMLDLSKEELGAVYEMARRNISVGQVEKAKSLFIMLVQIAPMEEQYTYGLAMTYQIQGDVRMAVKLYLHFISMDATNPQGYLRLGECLMAAKEYQEAGDAFEAALRMFDDPVKNYDDKKYAQTMMKSARQKLV
ncbi:Tetratricopeptide repeat-containing protein [Pseudovibrio denitrificans]|uniref:Tetratricopeptide repeat-containing protein n=2 Tax=Pseudovibrio TaxID=258255 RepID=A0A1I7BKD5_9HYPH|nr:MULTISPECIES: hypothetical protein [Pseudovibrio]EEA96502.1 tetratricopeptide repeat domain protein [Pseudovibrio sp. JE062]QUS54373.1 hypothetical protein KGB56_13310 [Pseudovibrio brasiliensis]SFT87644.1 Tetratricopeptide repeat-containing protein [Pseudovibrio denitrificans]